MVLRVYMVIIRWQKHLIILILLCKWVRFRFPIPWNNSLSKDTVIISPSWWQQGDMHNFGWINCTRCVWLCLHKANWLGYIADSVKHPTKHITKQVPQVPNKYHCYILNISPYTLAPVLPNKYLWIWSNIVDTLLGTPKKLGPLWGVLQPFPQTT